MKRSMFGLLAVLMGVAGCGGSNPGSGTKTLFVKAAAESDGATDGTWIVVEVRQGTSDGALLTDATVTLRGNKTGEFSMPWSGLDVGPFKYGGYYRGKALWDTGWTLRVRRGNDGLDAYVEAPGTTVVTEPIGGTTFRRSEGKPLLVRWKDSENRRAQVVTLDFDKSSGLNLSMQEDRLELLIDQSRLSATNKERLEVRRKNEVSLAGGTPGSTLAPFRKKSPPK
jgi:hypothetical protein